MYSLISDEAIFEDYEIDGTKITIRRDDLCFKHPLPPNAKMAALYKLVERAYLQGFKKVVMFAKKQTGTPYAIGLPPICHEFNMTCTIVYPKMPHAWMPDWIYNMQLWEDNVDFHFVRPNMITVNVNQSKKLAEEQGAYFIPFGFEHQISVDVHSSKFYLPEFVGALVVSTMTGMILAGILKQIYTRRYNVQRVYGISSGRSEASIEKSMRKYIDFDKVGHLTLFEAMPRKDIVLTTNKKYFPFPMHPDYEAKAWWWLLRNQNNLPKPIVFINSGR